MRHKVLLDVFGGRQLPLELVIPATAPQLPDAGAASADAAAAAS